MQTCLKTQTPTTINWIVTLHLWTATPQVNATYIIQANNKNIRHVYDTHIIHEYSHVTQRENSHATEVKTILFICHKEQQSMNRNSDSASQ